MNKVFVTGATGFVGRALIHELIKSELLVRAGVRCPGKWRVEGVEACQYDLSKTSEFKALLDGVDTLFHLAGRVHQLHESGNYTEDLYQRLNCHASIELARAAAGAGCRRMVYVSSIKVNGEITRKAPFCSDDPPNPIDAYARSKWNAEQGMHEVAEQTGLEVVVVRPPLVYGPGVGANFLRLMRMVERGIPLPLASIGNRRSLIYVGNLVDALLACAKHPEAVDKTYLVSDGTAISTADLVRAMATALGRRANLWPTPRWLLAATAALLGRGDEMGRVVGSLAVDDAPIRRDLGWNPPHTMQEGMAETARWLRSAVL